MTSNGIGARMVRKEDQRFITGRGRYTDDITLPRQSYACFVRSPHAHARIRAIDTTRAEAMPGVALVLDHRNTPEKRYTTAGQGYPEPSPYDARMFDTKVRWVGDRVAVVAADTLLEAQRAVETIEVALERNQSRVTASLAHLASSGEVFVSNWLSVLAVITSPVPLPRAGVCVLTSVKSNSTAPLRASTKYCRMSPGSVARIRHASA